MDYRNKLGIFSFDDDTQESHVKLAVQTVTGQYLNPKPGEPKLTDEQSCYDFIRDNCGNVLAGVGFDLVINENERQYTKEQMRVKKVQDFDQRVKTTREEVSRLRMEMSNAEVANLLDLKESSVRHLQQKDARGWVVGPAAVKS